MIITFSNSRRNLSAAEALMAECPQSLFNYYHLSRTTDSNDGIDHTLILLDLEADAVVQNLLSPEIVARKLYSSGILRNIKTIKILISDIVPEYPISTYAWELSKAILELDPNLSIPIVYVRQKSRSLLLIEPPTEITSDWIIHYLPFAKAQTIQLPEEIVKSGIPDTKKDYFAFFKANMPNIIFRGNVGNLFDTRGSTIEPDMVRKTYSI